MAILFFEIACDLLAELSPSSYSLDSSDNWDSFCQRYNISSTNQLFGVTFLETLRDNFKKEIHISFPRLKEILADHLHNRFEDALESVDFVRDVMKGDNCKEEALKRIQLFKSGRQINYSNYENEIQNFQPKYTFESFKRWEKGIKGFSKCEDKFSLFSAFSLIEEDFEKIELQINKEASQLDAAIQMETDRMRGK